MAHETALELGEEASNDVEAEDESSDERVRGVTLSEEQLAALNLKGAAEAQGVDTRDRPLVRADCEAPPRLCPWCEDRVVMRASIGGIHCPTCSGAVTLVLLPYASGEAQRPWAWEQIKEAQVDQTEGYEHARPCPFVGCRHHLYLDARRPQAIKLTYADIEPHEMDDASKGGHPSCSLDAADRGRLSLEGAGSAMNLTRERVRQIQEKVMLRVKRSRVRLRLLGSS